MRKIIKTLVVLTLLVVSPSAFGNPNRESINFDNYTNSDGSQSKPWSIDEAIEFEKYGEDKVGWVSGYIVGAVGPEVTYVKSNDDIQWVAIPLLSNTIVIGQSADTKDIEHILIIELPDDTELQASGNLVDNPSNYGKLITLHGYLAKTMGTYGITGNNGTKYEFEIENSNPSDDDISSGDGSENNPYTAAEVIAFNPQSSQEAVKSGVWVTGYIVGWADVSAAPYAINAETAHFDASATMATNILVAPSADVKDVSKCIGVQLPTGEIRSALNLQANPGNLGKSLQIKGDIIKYCGVPGIKNATAYKLEGGSTPTPTPTDPVASINENFDASSSIPAGWTQKQVTGDKAWYVPSFNGNNYAAMTGFKGNGPFDQWLISPAIDMSKVSKKVLTFDTKVNGYGSTQSALKVFVLTAADPTTAKTTQLNPTLATAPATGYSDWANSGELDLSAFSGIIYIGFEYTSPVADNYATWCVDNIKLNAEGGSTPDPDPTPTPAGDFNTFNNSHVSSKYGTYTNKTGWIATNAIILGGGETDANPIFKFIGTAGIQAPTLNGKTSAPGSLVSPVLSGGIKTLTFKYGFAFNEAKCQFTINVKDAVGNVIKSKVVTLDTTIKQNVYNFSLDVNYSGSYIIEIINNCYSQLDANKDRVSIWNINYNEFETFSYNGIQFKTFENSDSCYVIGGGVGNLIIPATAINPINNKSYKVTAIGPQAYEGNSNLKSVTFPEGLTSIGRNAFTRCYYLSSVSIPTSLQIIEDKAFSDCYSLNDLVLGNLRSCGYRSFARCTNLANVDFGSVSLIGDEAFIGCTNLKEAIIKTVSSIGDNAFNGCIGLKKIALGNLTSCGNGVFRGCTKLTIIDLGGMELMPDYFFSDCTSLTDINLSNVRSLGKEAFKGCSGLTTIDLKKVTSIGDSTFKGCSKLKTANLSKITTINKSTFEDCKSIASIDFGNVSSIGAYAFNGCASLTDIELIIPVVLGDSVFNGCSSLRSVAIDNVISWGKGVFGHCSSLTNIDLGNTSSIGNYAFIGCTSMQDIDLKKVSKLGDLAFYECTNLKSIMLGEVSTWGIGVFGQCNNLTDIDFGSTTSIGSYAFAGCTSIQDINLENVCKLGDYAFYSCSGISSVVIPNSVTAIGENAFGDCKKITYVTFNAEKCTQMDYPVFDSTNISFLTIGDKVTIIPDYAFSGCTRLTSVVIPNSVQTIGENAFSGCSGLTSVTVNNKNNKYDSRNNCNAIIETSTNRLIVGCNNTTIPNSVTSIGDFAFYGCSGLTNMELNNVANIGEYAFSGCSGLKSLSILKANNVDASTFNGCDAIETLVLPYEWGVDFKMTLSGTTQLRTLYIGENTASIPDKTFVNNKNLFEVYSNAATPPSIGTATFGSETYSYATLYVPQGSVDAYKAATGWSKFEDIQELPFQIVVKDKKVSVDRTKSILVSASVTPASATSSDVKWYSLNDEIATVTIDGEVTGIAEGGVMLVAYCDGITSTMKVIVKKFDGVEDVMADDPTELSEFDVYNLQGIRVRTDCTKEQLSELSHGIYILVSPQGRKKVII